MIHRHAYTTDVVLLLLPMMRSTKCLRKKRARGSRESRPRMQIGATRTVGGDLAMARAWRGHLIPHHRE